VLSAFAIRSAERRRRATELALEELAHRDPLTGLLNRRGLESELARAAARPREDRQGLALVLIDLDDFKQVNDTRGHSVGDQVLAEVGRALAAAAGEQDLVARLGGDEFAFATYASGEEVRRRAGEMAAAVVRAGESVGVSGVAASVGVAAEQPTGENPAEASFDELLWHADRELYEAKGRTGERRAVPTDRSRPGPAPAGQPAFEDESTPRLDDVIVRRLSSLVLPCAALAGAIGLAAMAGVVFDLLWLRALNEEAALAFTTSVGIVLVAAGMALAVDENRSRARRLLSNAVAASVGLIGIATLVEHGLDVDLGFNRIVSDPLDVPLIYRPDPETAVALVLTSAYLLLIDVRVRAVRIVWSALAIVVMLITWAALFSAVLGAGYLWQSGDAHLISLHGAVAAAALTGGLIAMRPRRGLYWPVTIASPAGHTTRRLMAAAIVVPLLTGMLLVLNGPSESLPLLAGLLTLLQVALLLMIALTTARTVERADADREELGRRLRKLADRDPLTGLFNRRRMEFEFEEEVARRRRVGGASALIVLDLDSLKQINDTLGHAAGDEALVSLARTLSERTRPTDTVARIGGDEFAVLLAGATAEQARAWAQAFAQAVAPLGPQGWREVKVSWGVAEFDAAGTDFGELFNAADVELYAVKRARQTVR
jgi:diguanylate cyclase (GGDEF)-like protein